METSNTIHLHFTLAHYHDYRFVNAVVNGGKGTRQDGASSDRLTYKECDSDNMYGRRFTCCADVNGRRRCESAVWILDLQPTYVYDYYDDEEHEKESVSGDFICCSGIRLVFHEVYLCWIQSNYSEFRVPFPSISLFF